MMRRQRYDPPRPAPPWSRLRVTPPISLLYKAGRNDAGSGASENLHRAELSVQERSEHIAEWVRITEAKKLVQSEPVLGKGGRGHEGGVRAAVRELGIDRSEAVRAIKIATIAPEAKAAAQEAGIDDNQAALLRVAKA